MTKTETKDQQFFFTNLENTHEVIESLSNPDCGRLFILAAYIDCNNILRIGEKCMDWNDIKAVVGLENNPKITFYKFKANMLKHKFIIEIQNKEQGLMLKLNPKYHFKGEATDQDIYLLKVHQINFMDQATKLNHNELGFLYKLISLAGYNSNMICANPTETDPTKQTYANNKDISKLLNVSLNTATKMMKKLKHVELATQTKKAGPHGSKIWFLNHLIFNRGNPNLEMDQIIDNITKERRNTMPRKRHAIALKNLDFNDYVLVKIDGKVYKFYRIIDDIGEKASGHYSPETGKFLLGNEYFWNGRCWENELLRVIDEEVVISSMVKAIENGQLKPLAYKLALTLYRQLKEADENKMYPRLVWLQMMFIKKLDELYEMIQRDKDRRPMM